MREADNESAAAQSLGSDEILFGDREQADVTLRSISDGVLSTDALGFVTYLNPVAESLTGWSMGEALGRPAVEVMRIVDEITGAVLEHPLMVAMRQNRVAKLAPHALLVRHNGSTLPIEDSAAPIHTVRGQIIGAVVVFRDITAARAQEAKILHLAEHDILTNLPNRHLFNDRLSQAIFAAKRCDKKLGILFLDLDRFKNINDSHGHSVGDRLLQSVANRLMGCVRLSDTVSRLGGDEFVILLSDLTLARDAALTAEKIGALLREPHSIDGHSLFISSSIGIVTYPDDGVDAETLLKNADLAMYLAKECGRNGYQFFEPKMRAEARRRQSLEQDLRQAIQSGTLELHYQPTVDLTTGLITGAEALLRWQHPSRGLVPTDALVSIAEESGLIVGIGAWVLREGCRQVVAWRLAGFCLPRIAINVSAVQVSTGGLEASVRDALAESGLTAGTLALELTETCMTRGSQATRIALKGLKRMGVSLALDDFGTGFSSLSHLIRFPIDILKIDQTFLKGLPHNGRHRSVVTAVISLARSLSMGVVAEGIETHEQCAFLKEHHCQEGQGFLFSKPVSAARFSSMIDSAARPFTFTGCSSGGQPG
jgi:diguanylate cyclase (GGDEF)-like protein/PAS domain S-box-containing protein